MKLSCLALTVVFVASAAHADSSIAEKRDRALKQINACLRANEVSSRQCKKLNKAVNTLVDVYQSGDKTVLPTLLNFTYLTDFYDEALTQDPKTFLDAVSHVSQAQQQAVAIGVAGGMFGLTGRDKFEKTREALQKVPNSSPHYELAQECLRSLDTQNGFFLASYFPPEEFTGPAADLRVRWYSQGLYGLQEKPLWPVAPGGDIVYRLTVVSGWFPPKAVVLRVFSDGTGQVRLREATDLPGKLEVDKTIPISTDQIAKVNAALNAAAFWQMPTQVRSNGLDGAQWIFEGTEGSQYHVVDRWCPGTSPLGESGRMLFDLAGYHVTGRC